MNGIRLEFVIDPELETGLERAARLLQKGIAMMTENMMRTIAEANRAIIAAFGVPSGIITADEARAAAVLPPGRPVAPAPDPESKP